MSAHVKICGLGRPIDVATCAQAGVRYVGFVFFEKSPRNLTYEAAKSMAIDVPVGIAKVALTVDASDEMLNAMLDDCLLYTSPSPRDRQKSRMPSSA